MKQLFSIIYNVIFIGLVMLGTIFNISNAINVVVVLVAYNLFVSVSVFLLQDHLKLISKVRNITSMPPAVYATCAAQLITIPLLAWYNHIAMAIFGLTAFLLYYAAVVGIFNAKD